MLKESSTKNITSAAEAVAWPFHVCYLFVVNLY